MDDTTHNLNVVREALEAEGLAVHVKIIDQTIEEVAALREQDAQLRYEAGMHQAIAETLRNQLVKARADAIEECAKAADKVAEEWLEDSVHYAALQNFGRANTSIAYKNGAQECAAAIRALTDEMRRDPDAGLPTAEDVRGILAPVTSAQGAKP